jgi:hypothetical protein
MKVFKKDENCTLYGANRWQEIKHNRSGEPYIKHYNRRYYLHEFMRFDHNKPNFFEDFDGYLNDSFFSGCVIKINSTGETAKVFTFIS